MNVHKIMKDEKQNKIDHSFLKGVNHNFLDTQNLFMLNQKQKMVKKQLIGLKTPILNKIKTRLLE